MAAPSPVRLPRLTGTDPASIMRTWDDLCRTVENELGALRAPAGQTGYTITNPSSLRALDVSAATLAQVRQVVGTMVADLKAKGQLG